MPNEDRSKGFYGPDGEFYPAGSSAAQTVAYEESDPNLYPKRPDINYTTQPVNAPNPPAYAGQPAGNYGAAGNYGNAQGGYSGATKYCKYCGSKIPEQAVICTHCGCQVEEIKHQQPAPQPVVVNNNVNTYNNTNSNNHVRINGRMKNKWLAFLLCLFGGVIGLHKFYEGKIIMGIIYACTGGLFGIGWVIDLIVLLLKPNPYSV